MIQIYYCVAWNYYPRAARLADLIKAKCGIEAQLLSGKRGEFTVWFNGVAIADKNLSVCDVFPPFEQIVETILRMQDQSWVEIHI